MNSRATASPEALLSPFHQFQAVLARTPKAVAALKSARGQTISQIGLSRLQDVQRKLQPSPTRRLQDILGGAA